MMKLFLFITCVVFVASLKWGRRNEDCLIKSKYFLNGVNGTGHVHGCLATCETVDKCESISWFEANTTCLLFNTNVHWDRPKFRNRWIALQDWKTYSRIKYPVALRMNPDPKYNWMSFDVAVQTCLDQSSEIATPEELLELRQPGISYQCYCGWLSNGLNGIVTVTENKCPTIGFSTGVFYCNETSAAAWCKLR